MKFGRSFGIFLNSAHLICRSTDISKCLSMSLRLRDNESRLYKNINLHLKNIIIYIYTLYTEDTRYNDTVCYQRLCCSIEFAVIKKLDMDPTKA